MHDEQRSLRGFVFRFVFDGMMIRVFFSACSIAYVSSVDAQEPLRLTTDATSVTVQAGNQLVARYRYTDVPFKPYVEQFCSPLGVNVLRDSPHDHKHHHGLMFAVSVDGVNFWEEHPAPGRQEHRRFSDMCVDQQDHLRRAGFTEQIDWVEPRSKKRLIQENRTIQVVQAEGMNASLLVWQSRFTLPANKASAALTGRRYFGLGMRFLQSMDTTGNFVNADGKTGVKDTNAAPSAWCAFTAQADGKPVTVVLFDHPRNVRAPATWFTMEKPFAYLSATMNLHKEPFTVVANKPLVLRYAVGLWDGRAETKQIENLYRQWLGDPKGVAWEKT